MNQGQIYQLANEYARSNVPEVRTFDDEDVRLRYYHEAKGTLEWLLRDCLIVEKAKVMEMYKDSDSAKYDKDYMMSQEARAECNLLEALFPEILNSIKK